MNDSENDDTEESNTDDPNESNETDESDSNESNSTESDETDGLDANESNEMIDEAGTPIIRVHVKVIDAVPKGEEAILSSDDRLDGVAPFTDLFEEIERASDGKSADELVGDEFSTLEDRKTERGEETMDAKSELPLTERTVRQTEEGVYVEHQNHILFMYFRVYHLD